MTKEKRASQVSRDTASLSELLVQLDSLPGLAEVKAAVLSLVAEATVGRRQEPPQAGSQASRHMVFCGNPGTGKTEVARLMGAILRQLGLLSSGHLMEARRHDLVSEYIGQAAVNVRNVVASAIGGVLLIDDPYTLWPVGVRHPYEQEVIDTLLIEMEINRKDLVVILAGRSRPIQSFFESNPGLKSRFLKSLEFPDYEPVDLVAIFRRFCDSADYRLGPGVEEAALTLFQQAWSNRDETFDNARLARNVFHDVTTRQARRLADLPALDAIESATLMTIETSDLTSASASLRG